ncbi:hypothetical protein QL285_067144 [Trifolium repens]|nr:hypothetical protein QL285_067144 [Trifolium repens]
MSSALMKILPPTTIRFLVAPTRFTAPSSASELVKFVPPEETIAPNCHRILDSSTSSTFPSSAPGLCLFRPPEESLASNCPWIFRTTLQAFTTLRPPECLPYSRSLAWLQTNLGLLGGSTSCNIKLSLYPTTSSSLTSYQV